MASSSLTKRVTRSTPTMSTPTRIRRLGGACTLRDQIGQVLHREVVDDLFGLQLAAKLIRIDLRHDRLQLLEALVGDDLVLVAELVVGDAALDVLSEVG